MEKIDAEEGAKRIASFRAQRLSGDFCFKFQLEHKPKNSSQTFRYNGVMFGSWNERGPVNRFQLYPERVKRGKLVEVPPIELIVQNGVSPEVWIRHCAAEPFVRIEDEALFKPIFDGVIYTPFDLQMPFIYWNDYTYEGPANVLSRIGQLFLMKPPEGSLSARHGISGVQIALDDMYYGLLGVEVFGVDGEPRSDFTLRSFQKVQGQYIVKEIVLSEVDGGKVQSSTGFKVKRASVGLIFDAAVFDPECNTDVPEISAALFHVL
ncbi:MAG: hypothetical protein HOO08_07200 [Opitutae bacterium]|jgi:hypothetical protein|nr:hypothetical protein [Opitutae bacterium]